MVDIERRKKLALHLRHLSVGLTTNDKFEAGIMADVTNGWLPEQYYRAKESRFDDPIIIPMLELCWGLYSDTKEHKLTGKHKLNEDALKIIAHCILFLNSDNEYEWPYFDTNNPLLKFSLKDIVLSILSLGKYYQHKVDEQLLSYADWKKLGDYDVWPFFKKDDYKKQLKFQPFLIGQS